MNLKNLKLVFLCLSLIWFYGCTVEKKITYADGSGNIYEISGSEEIYLEYNPVKPQMSSSGIYDGGDYRKIKISSSDYENIWTSINKALENKAIQIKERVMGSGLIVIQENDNKSSYIIKSGCQEQLEIEELLKEVMLQ